MCAIGGCSLIRSVFYHTIKRISLSNTLITSYNSSHFPISKRNYFKKILTPRKLTTMKLDSDYFKSLFTPELEQLIQLFKKHNFELRIAGGAVRDLLMDKLPNDIDLATTATPEQMVNMFNQEEIRLINSKGESHGTVTARINDKQNFEVTTLRIDVVTDGRRAKVEFTKDWELDANRRDLTVNSLFLGFDGTVYDYFDGIEDLKKRRVVFVGDPTTRICEDFLRILRYFRFYGRLANSPDEHDQETLEAIRAHANGLTRVSGERIWAELKKILTGNHVGYIIPRMLELGLGSYIGLPDSCNVENFKLVYERCQHLNPHPITLLTALVNDEKEMMQLHTRQKFSAYERDLGIFLVMNRGDKPHIIPLRPYQMLLLDSLQQGKHVQEWICEVFKSRGEIDMMEQFLAWQPPRFPINGNMLRERGIKVGKHFTLILKKLRYIWADSDFTMSEEELLTHLDSVIKELGIK